MVTVTGYGDDMLAKNRQINSGLLQNFQYKYLSKQDLIDEKIKYLLPRFTLLLLAVCLVRKL